MIEGSAEKFKNVMISDVNHRGPTLMDLGGGEFQN